MLFNKMALALCLFLLFGALLAAFTAARRGDKRRVRVLHFFRLGLGLSAFSYLFRLMGGPPSGSLGILSFLCCFGGTMLIWVGWLEHSQLLRERARPSPPHEEQDNGPALASLFPGDPALPDLNMQARRTLLHAWEETQRRRQRCVDTDHLLLGLLREPGSAGAHIMRRLNVKPQNIRLALGQPPETNQCPSPVRPLAASPVMDEPLPLTDRARQALLLAAQEAHRFDRASVGTDHLLLGLVLMGTGAAAAALFREGLTVEEVRGEVLKSRKHG